jgi:hypothetical protein
MLNCHPNKTKTPTAMAKMPEKQENDLQNSLRFLVYQT